LHQQLQSTLASQNSSHGNHQGGGQDSDTDGYRWLPK
jgi:hypothetical protein